MVGDYHMPGGNSRNCRWQGAGTYDWRTVGCVLMCAAWHPRRDDGNSPFHSEKVPSANALSFARRHLAAAGCKQPVIPPFGTKTLDCQAVPYSRESAYSTSVQFLIGSRIDLSNRQALPEAHQRALTKTQALRQSGQLDDDVPTPVQFRRSRTRTHGEPIARGQHVATTDAGAGTAIRAKRGDGSHRPNPAGA